MRVFISYSTKDGLEHAKKLYEVLTKRGHDAYLADHSIYVTQTIWKEIPNEIMGRERIIFVVTQSSQESKGQEEEYLFAISKGKKRMVLAEESSWKIVETCFPLLTIQKGLKFNRGNVEETCELVSTQLVRLQDQEARKEESKVAPKQKSFEKLDESGLDEREVSNCLENLSSSYYSQTIIPEAFHVKEVEDIDDTFVNIGFNRMLTREWFLPYEQTKTTFLNDFLFREFGSDVAFGEREYLVRSIMNSSKLNCIDVDAEQPGFFLGGLKEAMQSLDNAGHKPSIIFPSIPIYLTMHRLGKEAKVEYDNVASRHALRASFSFDTYKLRIIEPLGKIPKDTIVFADDAILWNVKSYPKQGVLYRDLGNSRLYPTKYVSFVTMTSARCDVRPEGIVILKDKTQNA
jgi:hypothetical protein